MKEREALTMVLDWLESCNYVYPTKLRDAIKKALAQPEQRKPLTDEQIAHATAPVLMGGNPSLTGIARAIEAAHGIKE